MARCEDCLKQDVCNRDVGHGYSVCPRYLSADVAPRSEVERLTIELEAMRGAANSYKMHYENLAREIFSELDSILKAHTTEQHYRGERFIPKTIDIGIVKAIADLKKKYGG